jgi:LacI family transcriptional regulator
LLVTWCGEGSILTNENGKRTVVTIQQVAREAGVSASTVSRVLNDRAGVGQRTRQIVKDTIQRLDFKPDVAARELVARKTLTIGWNDAYGSRRLYPFATLVREQLFNHFYRAGYRIEDVPCAENGLPTHLTDAMIIATPRPDDPRLLYLTHHNVPFVVAGLVPNTRCAGPDDKDGGHQAAGHLVRLGHRSFLVLMGKTGLPSFGLSPSLSSGLADQRLLGFRQALQEAGLELENEHIITCDYSTLGAFFATREASRRNVPFTAIFALSDEMAVGAIAAIQDSGKSVPEDVSVVGFDDMPEIGTLLTTLHQDIDAYTEALAKLTLESLDHERQRQMVIPVQLVVRGTTGPAVH